MHSLNQGDFVEGWLRIQNEFTTKRSWYSFWPFIWIVKSIGLISHRHRRLGIMFIKFRHFRTLLLVFKLPFVPYHVVASWFAFWYFIVILSLALFCWICYKSYFPMRGSPYYERDRDLCVGYTHFHWHIVNTHIDRLLPDVNDVFNVWWNLNLASAFVWNEFFCFSAKRSALLCCKTNNVVKYEAQLLTYPLTHPPDVRAEGCWQHQFHRISQATMILKTNKVSVSMSQ